jgi:glycopeptide antibiotics resistance protein
MITQVLRAVAVLSAWTLPFWILARAMSRARGPSPGSPWTFRREAGLAVFWFYLVVLGAITLMPLPISTFREPGTTGLNLVPFAQTAVCFAGRSVSSEGTRYCVTNVLGNLLLFVPLGAFLPWVFPGLRNLARVAFAGLLASAAIEALQFASRHLRIYRSTDIDDVLFNTVGAAIGFAVFRVVRAPVDADQ